MATQTCNDPQHDQHQVDTMDKKDVDKPEELSIDVYNEFMNASLLTTLLDQTVIKSLGEEIRGKSVVEFGCGYGRNVAKLLDAGAAFCLGIGSSERMIEATGHRITGGMTYSLQSQIDQNQPSAFIVQDCTKPFYRTFGQFDMALCAWAIGFASNDQQLRTLLNNILDQLKPGGKLIVTTDGFCAHSTDEQKIIGDLFGFLQPLAEEVVNVDPFLFDRTLYRPSKSSSQTGRPFTRDVMYTYKNYQWSGRRLMMNLEEAGFTEVREVPLSFPQGMDKSEMAMVEKLSEPAIVIEARKPAENTGATKQPKKTLDTVIRQPPADPWSGE